MILLTASLAAGLTLAQTASTSSRYTASPASPDGIGKRYMDREISGVMGWQGAPWLERQEREREERTDLLLKALALKPGMVVADIGPGTGLGVSGLFPVGYQNKWMPIAGEGGHVSLTASTQHEIAAIQQLQKRYGHVSAERVISGAGLVDLYHALCDLKEGHGREITTPAEVLERAHEVPTSTANEALAMFCGFLGSVAGDLALTLGARGGIYIGGGIVPRMGEQFASSTFRERFEANGRFKKYLQDVPTWVIHSPVSPALQGASEALSLTQWG